jgi:hypothetical protein
MSNYDLNKVNEMLEEIQKNDDIHLLLLLLHIIEENDSKKLEDYSVDYSIIQRLINSFTDLTNWERTNVLFKLTDATKRVVINKAKEFEAIARKEDKIIELEKILSNHINNYFDKNEVILASEEFEKLIKELKKLNPNSNVLKVINAVPSKESEDASCKN